MELLFFGKSQKTVQKLIMKRIGNGLVLGELEGLALVYLYLE